jgi:hypothetical protein
VKSGLLEGLRECHDVGCELRLSEIENGCVCLSGCLCACVTRRVRQRQTS